MHDLSIIFSHLEYRLIDLIPDGYSYSFRYHQFGYYLAIWRDDEYYQMVGTTEAELVEWLQKF